MTRQRSAPPTAVWRRTAGTEAEMGEQWISDYVADQEAKREREAQVIAVADEVVDNGDAVPSQHGDELAHAYRILRARYRALMHDGAVLISHAPKALIWSNEHQMWWRPERSGYTPLIEDAGRYDVSAAIDIVADSTVDGRLTFHRRGGGGQPVETVNEHVVMAPEAVIEVHRDGR